MPKALSAEAAGVHGPTSHSDRTKYLSITPIPLKKTNEDFFHFRNGSYSWGCVRMPDGELTAVSFTFVVPHDMVSLDDFKIYGFHTLYSGDICYWLRVTNCTTGEDRGTHHKSAATYPTKTLTKELLVEYVVSDDISDPFEHCEAGDVVCVTFYREGLAAGDTIIGAHFIILGVLEYTADQ